jgi:hypothetical protein
MDSCILAENGYEDANVTALQPCTVHDMLRYLRFVEHSAEHLEFYLWHEDYTKRFEALSAEEKDLSPAWDFRATSAIYGKTGIVLGTAQEGVTESSHSSFIDEKDDAKLSSDSRATLLYNSECEAIFRKSIHITQQD